MPATNMLCMRKRTGTTIVCWGGDWASQSLFWNMHSAILNFHAMWDSSPKQLSSWSPLCALFVDAKMVEFTHLIHPSLVSTSGVSACRLVDVWAWTRKLEECRWTRSKLKCIHIYVYIHIYKYMYIYHMLHVCNVYRYTWLTIYDKCR